MTANRCPNPECEYFNRALPVNAKVCPWCSTPLGNVVPPAPNSPPDSQPQQQQSSQQQRFQQQPFQQQPPHQQPSQQPAQQQPPQQPASDYYVTNYQQLPYIPPVPQQQPPVTNLPVLKLIHSANGREFTLCAESGSIGRRTPSMPIPPEIDLSGIPQEGIVSRRHARIFWDWSQNTYMIVDISKNGIYLNGTPLNSGVSYRLLSGDTLQLGQENLVIFTIAIG
ncbi:FHA domain-containing protein [Rivularia sp. UHCC 0363]|uniref:FHA domain-containing protein n=1 Tax=Rivularia sp. UHCC 0363 TaxID=3110244 RepID=UPI002B212F8D|nr:FHA domain-containing protein [Rivularia sp. UHCC 0363]MEA5598426.1 FHA domain-containing protein [Rivularia sp. UHCC 0363]